MSIRRLLSLFKILTLSRTVHFSRLLFWEKLAAYTGRVKLMLPYALSIEISSVCNLQCPQCPAGTGKINRQNKFIDPALAQQIIQAFAPKGIVLNLYFEGESLLHPHFFEIARYAASQNLFTILSTNATLINKDVAQSLIRSGIDRIIISVDGIDQATYERYRAGGDAKIVWDSIRLLNAAREEKHKARPEIIIQTLVSRYNEHQLHDIADQARAYGADKIRFKNMQLYDHIDQWLPENKKFRRYNREHLKKRPKGKCMRAFGGMVVTSDGIFVPCCFDKMVSYPLGNAGNLLSSAAKGNSRKQFLEAIYKRKVMHDICTNCPEAMHVYPKISPGRK